MKKIKIIHILCHLPSFAHINMTAEEYFDVPSKGKYHKLDYPPYWVGFFIDHHVFAAQDLSELTDEFEIECWRPYGYGLREAHEEKVNGIKHKVFPATQKIYPQFGSLTWSDELFNALVKEILNNKVIVNLSVGHAWFHIKLMLKLKRFKNRYGLVALHRSGGFRNMSFKQLTPWKRIFKWYYLIESYIDAVSLRYCDHYFIGSIIEANYINKKHPEISSSFFMEGIDFNKYKQLSDAEKKNLRFELGLPLEKTILVAYGNWKSDDYAYQDLLEVFREIKKSNEGKDLELLLIGGYKTQDLYPVGISSGAIMVERVPKDLFIKYLEACDCFVQTCFSWGFIHFGGFGTAMIEALACGMPVISGNIIHFPGTMEERNKIGLDVQKKEALKKNIIYLKNNLNKFSDCRELAQKYFDIKDTRMVLLNKYRELAKQYFGDTAAK